MVRRASIWNYIGLGGTEEQDPMKETIRALPGNWYTSEEMYQLERRAIFSRRWMLMTHKSRFVNVGDFVRYNVANFDIVLSKSKNGDIHCFHNVCRHRAYPVVETSEGNAKIFACRYHGWSYGLNGSLAKAPQYQEFETFDKSKNSLFPIHVRIDRNDFVWINLDSNPQPEVGWESTFDDVDIQERFVENKLDFTAYQYDHTWKLEGPFNWKILADNFNECYHCKTTHPDLQTGIVDLESYDVQCKDDHIQHMPSTPGEFKARGLEICSTYCFPNVSFTVTKHFIQIQKFLPSGPGQCTMYYEYWRNKESSEEDFLFITETYKRVMAEDKVLCERAQQNINAGVFSCGELHPQMEKGPLFFQKRNREIILEYAAKEKKAGKKIWPATQRFDASKKEAQSDELQAFCEGLDCGGGDKGVLAW